MIVVEVLVAAVVLFALAAVAAGRGGGLADAPPDGAGTSLPHGPFGATELQGLAFSVVMRGYDMKEVDEALDRVAVELARRDERIRQLSDRSGHADREWGAPAADRRDSGLPEVAESAVSSPDREPEAVANERPTGRQRPVRTDQWQPDPDAVGRDRLR